MWAEQLQMNGNWHYGRISSTLHLYLLLSMAHLCSSGLCCFSLIIHRICWFMFQNVPNILSITSGPLAGVGRHGQGRRINISLEHSDIEMSPNLYHLCVSTICMCAVIQLEYQYCTCTLNAQTIQDYIKTILHRYRL